MSAAPSDGEHAATAAHPSIELPKPWSDAPIAVVVPTYNEAENLPVLAQRVFALALPNLQLIIVDDNSPDGTGEVADRLAAEANEVRTGAMMVVHRTAKEGIGKAYVNGLSEALANDNQFVVQMDCDLSHAPEAIP